MLVLDWLWDVGSAFVEPACFTQGRVMLSCPAWHFEAVGYKSYPHGVGVCEPAVGKVGVEVVGISGERAVVGSSDNIVLRSGFEWHARAGRQ